MRVACIVAVLLCAQVTAQRVLFQHHGAAGSALGMVVRPAGDVDGDGALDFVATRMPSNSVPDADVEVVSGRTGRVLMVLGPFTGVTGGSTFDAVGLGDADGDARSDIAVVTYSQLQVFSGATGALIATVPSPSGGFSSVSEAGDQDDDGFADCAVCSYAGGNFTITVVQGRSGSVIRRLAGLPTSNSSATLRMIGDINGDARPDLALDSVRASTFIVATTTPMTLWRTIDPPDPGGSQRRLETADLDGDGRRELLLARSDRPATTGSQGRVEAYDAATGLLLRTLAMSVDHRESFGTSVCGIGDLDRDGVGDVAVGSTGVQPYGEVAAFSGRTGAVLWIMPGLPTHRLFGYSLADLGDVDGDGFHEIAVGCPGQLPIGGGWVVVSGRILAASTDKGGACGGGPYLPQLGTTRFVLGQSATIQLRDAPSGAVGLLAFSLAPTWPTYLGASTCYAWFDFGNWLILHQSTLPAWSLTVPIPDVPQLAGIDAALQTIHGPTGGPLGFDLSNGVWAKFGY